MTTIGIELTKSGLPVLGVGGGSLTNTGHFRVILDTFKNLRKPCFIKKKGDLSCSKEQALVIVKKGDIIIDVTHRKDISKEAVSKGDVTVVVHRIHHIDIQNKNIQLIELSSDYISYNDIPLKCWYGSTIFHNRDGSYFVSVPHN